MPDAKTPMEAEHLCIKCGTTGLDDEMYPLLIEGQDNGAKRLWVHSECCGQYEVGAVDLFMRLGKVYWANRDKS